MSEVALQEVEPGKNYISGVPSTHISEPILERLVPMLEGALKEEHDATIESVILDLFKAEMQLWVVNDFEGILLTRIMQRARRKILGVEWMIGENMKGWLEDWMPIQMEFAKANGCARIEFGTPRSVERTVKRMHPEFKPMYTIYRCKVE